MYLSKHRGCFRRIAYAHNAHCEARKMFAQPASAAQELAFRVALVQGQIVTRYRCVHRRAQHTFEFFKRYIEAFGRTVQEQMQAILAVSAVQEFLLAWVDRGS